MNLGGPLEDLPGLPRVLLEELADLFFGEGREGKGRHLDVERARAPEATRIAPARHLALPDVPEAAQDDRPGGALRPLRVGVAELTEDSDEALAADRVDLVEQENHRSGAGRSPLGEEIAKERLGAQPQDRRGSERLGELNPRLVDEAAPEGLLGGNVIVPGGLRGLAAHVERGETPRGGEVLSEGPEEGGLPGLPGRMEDEVVAGLDVPLGAGHAGERRQHVMVARITRARDVEPLRPGRNVLGEDHVAETIIRSRP